MCASSRMLSAVDTIRTWHPCYRTNSSVLFFRSQFLSHISRYLSFFCITAYRCYDPAKTSLHEILKRWVVTSLFSPTFLIKGKYISEPRHITFEHAAFRNVGLWFATLLHIIVVIRVPLSTPYQVNSTLRWRVNTHDEFCHQHPMSWLLRFVIYNVGVASGFL